MGRSSKKRRASEYRKKHRGKPANKEKKRRPPIRPATEVREERGLATLRFLGGARTTTGSLHRLRVPAGDVLLECGMYQGHRAEAEEWNRDLPVTVERVKAVVLSHAHIDHSGALPNLVKRGFRGPIYCTDATASLLPVMLLDAAHIQESDTERINRRLKPGEPRKEPLYTKKDAQRTLDLVHGVPYGQAVEAVEGVEARFVDAGHIIGSAAIHMTIRAGGETTTLGFTGDLGRKDVPILRDPEPLGQVDWYMTESTYGDRDHENTGDLLAKLEKMVNKTVKRGGKIIIPAFAVGRTQLVLYMLHKLRFDDRIPDIPFFVDSPMAIKATHVFEQHKDLYDEEARDFVTCCGPLFDRARTSFVSAAEDSKALNHLDGSAVILSASGMCEGGRILHHLRNHGTDPRNLIVFVGYQAEHTLGRRILEGKSNTKIFGQRVSIEAEVDKINGLSAHADRNGLLRYVKRLDSPPENIIFVHGETEKIDALQSFFNANGVPGGRGPKPGDWVRLL